MAKKTPPVELPFEDVHLSGELVLLKLTPEIACVRISKAGSERAYSVNLPIFALRDWIDRVDAALLERAHNGAGSVA